MILSITIITILKVASNMLSNIFESKIKNYTHTKYNAFVSSQKSLSNENNFIERRGCSNK